MAVLASLFQDFALYFRIVSLSCLLAKPGGGDVSEPEAFSLYISRHDRASDQRGREFAERRSCLNAIATLADEPEETFGVLVKATYRIAVGHERSEASPTALEPCHLDIDRLLEAGDAFGQCHVVGIGIMRLDRLGLGG